MTYSYPHPRPLLTVDAALFGLDEEDLKVLVIKRARPPFENRWALPGGHVDMDESVDEAVRRELREETGLDVAHLEQFHAFGAVHRDPSRRAVTVAYYGLVRLSDFKVKASTDAKEAVWVSMKKLPEWALAFDHQEIATVALERLREKVRRQPIGFHLLPTRFTLSHLQRLYQVILDRDLDKRNFRKKVQSLGVLKALDAVQKGVAHRAARLYAFDARKYREASKRGVDFNI